MLTTSHKTYDRTIPLLDTTENLREESVVKLFASLVDMVVSIIRQTNRVARIERENQGDLFGS